MVNNSSIYEYTCPKCRQTYVFTSSYAFTRWLRLHPDICGNDNNSDRGYFYRPYKEFKDKYSTK